MRYCSGKGSDLGNVSALPQTDFVTLCAEVIEKPARLTLTREQFHALPDKPARDAAKRVAYITPATFKTSPSRRKSEFVEKCNLIALDVDDSVQAKRLMQEGALDPLMEFGFIVWQTASSTKAAPRLRILVHAEGILFDQYKPAVRTVGEILGLRDVTTESLIPVQPMYLPTIFAGPNESSPIVASNPDGSPFMAIDIVNESDAPVDSPSSPPDESVVGDLSHYRAPMDNLSKEEVAEALAVLDPDMAMGQWIEMAAGLKHQFGEDGYELWDQWSAKGKKYTSADDTAYRWSTLKAQPLDRAPVTVRSLLKLAQSKGWTNKGLAKRTFQETVNWMKSPDLATEELLDNAPRKIALACATVGPLERNSLMQTFKSAMAGKGMPLPITDIRQSIRNVEVEIAKKTGIHQWAQGWCYITSINTFYRPSTDRRYTPEVMDMAYGSLPMGAEQSIRPRDYLMQVAGVPQVEALRYDPTSGEKRFFSEGGVPFVNTYRATFTKPDPSRAQEAGDIFQQHIRNLIKEEEHGRTLIDFLAYHVQHPGKKIRWATLIQGGQGCGKTGLAVAMAPVLGRRNLRKVSASNVMEGTHNSWAYGNQLVVMEEVRIVGHNRHSVMDQMKPCISDDEISYRELYSPPRTVPNITNYLMFTNHFDALAVNDGDRRYFVLSSPLQQAHQIAALGKDYFPRFFGMIRDNPGGLRAWFEQWTISSTFDPEGRAPQTRYLKELASNSASPLAAAVSQTIEDQPHPLVRNDILSLSALRDHIDTTQANKFSDQALASVLREMGWTKLERTMIGGARHQIWIHGEVRDPIEQARDRLEVL